MINKSIICLAALGLASCQTIPAKSPEAAPDTRYRASGTEPFWSLAIDGKRMVFTLAGERHVFGAGTVSRPSFNGWRHVSKTITADVTFSPCSDGMSDRIYKDSVTVMVGDRTFQGCGGGIVPPENLDQTHWRILSINSFIIEPERGAELSFDGKRMSGTIGCNRLGAEYSFDGKALLVGPVMATKMACPEPVSGQEHALLTLLDELQSIRFTGDGAMVLEDKIGGIVVLDQSM